MNCSKCGQPFKITDTLIGHETSTWHEQCPQPTTPPTSHIEPSHKMETTPLTSDEELRAKVKQVIKKHNCYADEFEINDHIALITQALHDQDVESRIDELSNVQLEHGRYVTQTFVDDRAVSILDRIKELTKAKEQK